MNKAELIDKIAEAVDVSKATAARALDAVTESITKELKKGDGISLTGFGTFTVAKRKARTGRNPRTGQEIRIPARKTAKFRPGKALKEAVK